MEAILMRRTAASAALLAFVLMGGCETNYFKVHDPDTGRTYYTKGWIAEMQIGESNKEIELVDKAEYDRAVEVTER